MENAVPQRKPEIVTERGHEGTSEAYGISLCLLRSNFIKFWYPHLQQFQRSSDNYGKLHVRIILGHPIPMIMSAKVASAVGRSIRVC